MASSTAAVLLTCSEELLKDADAPIAKLLADDTKKRMEALLYKRPENWATSTADVDDRSSVKKMRSTSRREAVVNDRVVTEEEERVQLVFRVETKIDFDELDRNGPMKFLIAAMNKTILMVNCVRAGYGILEEYPFSYEDALSLADNE